MKRWVALLAAATLAFVLFGCAGGGDNTGSPGGAGSSGSPGAAGKTYTLKVWAAQDDQDITQKLINDFKAANPDNTYNITLSVVGEDRAYTTYSEDPSAAADIFYFANDQLRSFVNAGGLYEVTRNKDAIINRNLPASIEAATLDGKLWAYPATADNGYFLYYDKSILSADDVKTLDGMVAKADAQGKKIYMDVSNGWYIASFFFGAGGQLGRDEDGVPYCDFNNAKGLAAAEAIKTFTASSAFLTGDDGLFKGGLGSTVAAGVSGTWNASDIKGILGDNYAAAKLPTFTLDGVQTQMSSFSGYKMVGVNSLTSADNAPAAFDLADFLTNENSQIERFTARNLGPSNTNAMANPAVKDESLDALAEQNKFAIVQNNVPDNYWDPAGAFGETLEAKDYSMPLQDMLDAMVAKIVS